MIEAIIKREGYLYTESEHDTTNIICSRGHIYADAKFLVASVDNATVQERRNLSKIGTVVMDGDGGELSVKFPVSSLSKVARIMKPRYTR